MKKPRLILHIGSHKTGTTGIQRYCSARRDLLMQQGIYYPNYDIIGEKGHYAHHAIAHGFAGINQNWPMEKIREFFAAVAKRSPADGFTLISAEPFYRHVLSAQPGRASYMEDRNYWVAKENYSEAVAQALEAFDVEIIAVFRKQTDYFNSLYQEMVKVTKFSGSTLEFYLMKRHEFDFFAQTKTWADCFPKVRVLVFEELLKTGNLIHGFLNAVGQKSFDLPEITSKENTSLHPLVVEAKRRWNAIQTSLEKADCKEMSAKSLNNLQNFGIKHGIISANQKRSCLTTAEAQFLSLTCRTSNRMLRRRYFPGGSEELQQFSPDGAWLDRAHIGEDEDAAVEKLLARMLKEQV